MNVTFDMANATRNFASGIDQMSKLTGIDAKAIVLAEAGSVLKKAMSETKGPPSQATLTLAGRLRALKALGFTRGGQVTITAGMRNTAYGTVFLRKKDGNGYRRTHDGNFHPLNQHYTDAQWEVLQNAINDAKITVGKVVPETKASAGLARQSWLIIADTLGIRLEAVPGGGISAAGISTARAARARGNRQLYNGASKTELEAGKFAVTLINRLPYGNKLRFQGILSAAVAGRVKFMQTALQKGFVGSVQDVAKLFPGWTINAGSN